MLYAGDDPTAMEEVFGLIHFLGFTPVNRGSLRNAREIEDVPVQRFPNWRNPLIVSCMVFMWFFLLGFGKFNICFTAEPHGHEFENVTGWEWKVFWKNLETVPLKGIGEKYLACHALTMLALCYLPGCLAAYIQLYRGTKYSRFPSFLDKWLKMRKQLGLLMLLSASLHVIIIV